MPAWRNSIRKEALDWIHLKTFLASIISLNALQEVAHALPAPRFHKGLHRERSWR
jgi:hypothetical protein